jgi:phenylacetate-coenzyme A ligase PaaK-like adenylate-forming protein
MHAFLEVPYYSQKWAAAGVTVKDLEKLELTDLPRIPVTSKRDLVGSYCGKEEIASLLHQR